MWALRLRERLSYQGVNALTREHGQGHGREALAAHRASFWSKCLNWVPRGKNTVRVYMCGARRVRRIDKISVKPNNLILYRFVGEIHDEDKANDLGE